MRVIKRNMRVITRDILTNEKVTAFYHAFASGCDSLLDLGCCEGSHTKYFQIPNKLFVDVKRESSTLDPFLKADIRYADKLFTPKSYDLVVAIDVIEHLRKDEGYKLLQEMEKIARRRVLIFSPQGDYMVGQCQEGQSSYDAHWSGWTAEEFDAMGYFVILCPDFHPTLGIGAFWAWKILGVQEINF